MHKTFTTCLHSVWLSGLPIYVWPFIISPSVTSLCVLLRPLSPGKPAPSAVHWHWEPEARCPWFPKAVDWLASDGQVSRIIVTGSFPLNWTTLGSSNHSPHVALVLELQLYSCSYQCEILPRLDCFPQEVREPFPVACLHLFTHRSLLVRHFCLHSHLWVSSKRQCEQKVFVNLDSGSSQCRLGSAYSVFFSFSPKVLRCQLNGQRFINCRLWANSSVIHF